jgi:hypothetical protein
MRRASTILAVLALGVLALPAVASAVPTMTFKAKAVPIPGFKGTGNIYGAGSAVEAEYTISGTEYLGAPPPIIGVNFYLPKGTVLHTSGFPTCLQATLEREGPLKCPKGSAAGPIGSVTGFVNFGHEPVVEDSELYSFYSPGGGLEFFTDGHEPVSLEIPSFGKYVNLKGSGGYGPELKTKVPLVPSVPGAPDASVSSIKIKAGSAYKSHGKTIYYGRVPKKGLCPKSGFNLKTEVTFAENGEESHPVTVTKTYKSPCPRK